MPEPEISTSGTILIVDDDAAILMLLERVLGDAGYDVLQAVHGGIALELVRDHPVDLVLIDLVMPEREGLETIMALRRERTSLPIVAMSGMDEGACLEIAAALGANATLKKPFSRAVVLQTVRTVLERAAV